jgi:hypothetical protein
MLVTTKSIVQPLRVGQIVFAPNYQPAPPPRPKIRKPK